MKQFIVDRHTAPLTPTLEQVPTEKIPTYESLTDAESDLTNLNEGQIIATLDDGADELLKTVDTVEDNNMHPVTSNAVAETCVPIIKDNVEYEQLTLPTSGQTIQLTAGWYALRAGVATGSTIVISKVLTKYGDTSQLTVPYASAETVNNTSISGGIVYLPADTYTVTYSGTVYLLKLHNVS